MEFNTAALVETVKRQSHELTVALNEARRLGIEYHELRIVKRNKKTFIARATTKAGEVIDFKCNY